MVPRNTLKMLLGSTAIVLISSLTSSPALAQDSIQLDQIVVTTNLDIISDATTKTDDAIVDTLAGTSVVTRDEVERFQPDSAAGLLTSVPGVNVEEANDDPGSAINIRGLQDFGRVNVMIDGARQNFQRSGHNANGQFYLEPEMIKQVDVVRGPVSTIYGSGAIGGVVNFQTIDPADMLRHHEKWAASLKTAYSTNDEGILLSAIGAFRLNDKFSAIGNLVWRDLENYEDGNGNEVENSEKELKSALIKGVYDIAPGNQLKLSYIHKDDEYTTGLLSDTNRQATEAEDRTISAQWAFNPADNDLVDLHLSAYFTSTKLEQTRLDDTAFSSAGNERFFEIETIGFDIYNSSRFAAGGLNHTFTYGGDFFEDRVKTEDLGRGGSGDEFTPSGERNTYGFFIQDKLEYSNWLEIIAALRYDKYELDGQGLNVKDDQLSPKITVGITPFEGVQFYATYAEGFRAPAITETLQTGQHPVPPFFDILPNPNLKPETAENWEAGVNLSFNKILNQKDAFRAKLSVYRNDVQDFIEDRPYGGTIPGPTPDGAPTCLNFGFFCNIYLNIPEVRLQGFELEAAYDAQDWFVNVAYTYTRGEDLGTGDPLISVYPHKLITTLGMRLMNEKLVVGGRWTYSDSQDRVPPIPANFTVADLPTPSYNLVDLFATYKVNETLDLGLTLNNIFDEQYRIHRHEEPEPGFSARISATIRFGG